MNQKATMIFGSNNFKKIFQHTFFTPAIIIFFIILGFLLRVWRINQAPSRLTVDELSIGYNAFSILETGRDEWGRFLPLSFEAFGDYKQPLYIYLTVPFIQIFGLTPLGVRAVSILSGTAIIFLSAVWIKPRWGKKVAIFTAFILALSPWAMHISRIGFESNLALALFILGLIAFDQAQTTSKKWLVLSGVCFGLTWYTYIAFRLLTVLMVVSNIAFSWRQKQLRNKWVLTGLVMIGMSLPLFTQMFSGAGTARFSQVSFFYDKGVSAEVLERRNFCFLVDRDILPRACQIFFNRYTILASHFVQNYIAFYSPEFLFWQGDQVEYLNPPKFGEFFLVLLPFYLIGIWFLLGSQLKKSNNSLFGLLMILAPIPSALVAQPQIVRGSLVLFLVSILIAIGLARSWKYLQLRKFAFVVFGLFIIGISLSSFQYVLQYHAVYAQQHETAFSPFHSELIDVVNQAEQKYDHVYFSNRFFSDAHIYLAFYKQIDPSWYQKQIERPEPDAFGFSHPIKLGKYEFGGKNLKDFVCSSDTSTLYFTNDQSIEKNDAEILLYDFSKVHNQVIGIDIENYRNKLLEQKQFESVCPKTSI